MYDINKILQNLSQMIQIPSVQGPAEEGAPFGRGPRQALDEFLAAAKKMGFETNNIDGYAGEVLFGEGREFAILAHLDVVPAGNGWTHEPFGGEIDYTTRRVWGRGAMDDKGPAVIVLHALKALKDSGFVPRRKIKFILGTNEESGWGCIDYYKTHAHMPDEGFTPDADFPVIYAEKGILQAEFTFKTQKDVSALKGGSMPNMVCDYCEIQAPLNSPKLEQLGLEYAANKAISHGVSAHGSTPEKGVNAIPPLLIYAGLEEEVLTPLTAIRAELEKFCDQTGPLTFSPNMISGQNGAVKVVCDIRYPATMAQQTIFSALDKLGADYRILHSQAPLYNDKNGFLISTLCNIYNAETGKNAHPIAIGGGTYARALKFGAGFGPEEEGEESTMHRADEYITFEKIERCFNIYRRAIEELTK